MGIVVGTLAKATEFAGRYKFLRITYTPVGTPDTITLTAAAHGISTILFVIPKLTAGYDANLTNIFATYSGLDITVATTLATGAAADNWAGATAELLVIGY